MTAQGPAGTRPTAAGRLNPPNPDAREVLAVAVHLTAALEGHRARAERQGRGVPHLLRVLEQITGFRVMQGQAGSTFDATAEPSQPVPMPPRLLTYAQAADALAVSESTVKRLISAGDLTAVRVGDGASRIRVADLDAYVATIQPAPQGAA